MDNAETIEHICGNTSFELNQAYNNQSGCLFRSKNQKYFCNLIVQVSWLAPKKIWCCQIEVIHEGALLFVLVQRFEEACTP